MLLPNPNSDSQRTDNDGKSVNSDNSTEINVLKGKPRTLEQDLPQDIIRSMEHNICTFVTYHADSVDSVKNFESIKSNTECIFAKRAKVWGSPQWKDQLNLEENVLR